MAVRKSKESLSRLTVRASGLMKSIIVMLMVATISLRLLMSLWNMGQKCFNSMESCISLFTQIKSIISMKFKCKILETHTAEQKKGIEVVIDI